MTWVNLVIDLFNYLKAELQTELPDVLVELGNDAKDPRQMTLRVIRGTGDFKQSTAFDHQAEQVLIVEGWVYGRDRLIAYEQLAALLELAMNLLNVWQINHGFMQYSAEIQDDQDAFAPSYGFRIIITTVANGHGLTEGCLDENRRILQEKISG